MTSYAWFTLLVAAVGVERLAELVVARRNLRWATARGGVEHGQSHYPWMVALHVGLLVGALVEVWGWRPPWIPWLGWPMLALVGLSQALRWWCIATLGRRWNTKVVVLPGEPLVHSGPYRWLAHPNYVAVAVEGVALPMVNTAWVVAITFTLLNGLLMRTRVGVENRALRLASD